MGNNEYKKVIVFVYLLLVVSVYPQMTGRDPSIGYVYPAGGQQGSVIQITIGGQNLQNVSDAYITGDGIIVKKVVHIPPLNSRQRQELQRRINNLRRRYRGLPPESPAPSPEEPPITFPPHPLLENLDNLTPKEIEKVVDIFITPFRRLQRKISIQEMVLVDIEIYPSAPLGNRELRLQTPRGITNPLCFQIGAIPEVLEEEPNDPTIEGLPVQGIPVVFNGQIMPGDVDRFRFNAHKGQNLVIEVYARGLIPYMADAVPGWFQATLTLYNSQGKKIAYIDDYRFSPDPVMFFNVPEDGDYTIEIKDALYRGREDFVYRLSISERPFVTSIFPLGGKERNKATVSLNGINIPEKYLLIDTSPGPFIRKTFLYNQHGQSNPILYTVDSLPEHNESRHNNSIDDAEYITLPKTINGRIERQGDVDIFKFECPSNFELVAEVYARRLGSPLDSLLRVVDSSGRILVWNDDKPDKASGLNTHHSDSYIHFKIPKSGTYFIQISDAQGYGGEEYTYRLRLSSPQPDYNVIVTPSAINIPTGSSIPFDVYVIHKDGFNEAIELSLKDMPEGFILSGNRIPAGKKFIRMTITAPAQFPSTPSLLKINMEARTIIDGKEVIKPLIPTENMMQAFGLYHLVPSETFLVSVLKPNFRNISVALVSPVPLKIFSGKTTEIQIKIPPRMVSEEFILELKDPPDGISLKNVEIKNGMLTFNIEIDSTKVKEGLSDNLIVEVFTNSPIGPKDEKGNRTKQKISRGFLPAIPFEII
ncbi:MAG: PPC domain-containing protein [Candidatus Omnitrophica bacterium]|nr:PPC domain-containing protein [Candidatus Omnitrophota bacterium]